MSGSGEFAPAFPMTGIGRLRRLRVVVGDNARNLTGFDPMRDVRTHRPTVESDTSSSLIVAEGR